MRLSPQSPPIVRTGIRFLAAAPGQARSTGLKPSTQAQCESVCLGVAGGLTGGCAVIVPALCGALNLWNAEIGFFPCVAIAEPACVAGGGGIAAICSGICAAIG